MNADIFIFPLVWSILRGITFYHRNKNNIYASQLPVIIISLLLGFLAVNEMLWTILNALGIFKNLPLKLFEYGIPITSDLVTNFKMRNYFITHSDDIWAGYKSTVVYLLVFAAITSCFVVIFGGIFFLLVFIASVYHLHIGGNQF